MGIRHWGLNCRGWGCPAFLSAEPALAGNLWQPEQLIWPQPPRASCDADLCRGGGKRKVVENYIVTRFKMFWGSQNVILASKPQRFCCRALETAQSLHRSRVSVHTHMLCSQYGIKWKYSSFCRACSHSSLGLPVWFIQGDAMKIRSLANLGVPASCSLFQDVIPSAGRGNGGGEGVSTDPS